MDFWQHNIVYNMLSLGIASMLFTSIFLWFARERVLPKYRMAVMVSATVTSIAAYHYVRMFDSFNKAYKIGGDLGCLPNHLHPCHEQHWSTKLQRRRCT